MDDAQHLDRETLLDNFRRWALNDNTVHQQYHIYRTVHRELGTLISATIEVLLQDKERYRKALMHEIENRQIVIQYTAKENQE